MIMINKILVPTDLSSVSVPAIGYASSLATERDAEVVLLHVAAMDAMKRHLTGYGDALAFPVETRMSVQRIPDIDNFYEEKKRRMLVFLEQKIAPDLRRAVKIRPLVRLGKVVEETIAVAREEQCDLIVMTSEGGHLRHLFGASNTERIVRQAPCPVLSMQPAAQIRTKTDQRLQVKRIDQWAA
jgi:nucleotide-binding universal stress UspA family protein